MSAFPDYDSAGTHKFAFEIDGIVCKTIKSVDGLTLKLDKVETKSNTFDGKPIHKAWAGNRVYLGTLTVTRVMTDDPTWDVWYSTACKDVNLARKSGHITIMTQDYRPTREYSFKHAWPIELKVTNMNAATPNPIEETVTFVYEEIEVKNLS